MVILVNDKFKIKQALDRLISSIDNIKDLESCEIGLNRLKIIKRQFENLKEVDRGLLTKILVYERLLKIKEELYIRRWYV